MMNDRFENLSPIPADDDTGFEDWMDGIQSADTDAKIAYTTDQTARSTHNAIRATVLIDKNPPSPPNVKNKNPPPIRCPLVQSTTADMRR